jgi:hypothetical protein
MFPRPSYAVVLFSALFGEKHPIAWRCIRLPLSLVHSLCMFVEEVLIDAVNDPIGVLFYAAIAALVFCSSCASSAALHKSRVQVDAAMDDVRAHSSNLPSTTLAKCQAAQDSLDALDDDVQAKSAATLTAAETGNVPSLVLQLLGGALGLPTTGYVTYRKVMNDRDASSPQRTADELKDIAATAGALASVSSNPQPKAVS